MNEEEISAKGKELARELVEKYKHAPAMMILAMARHEVEIMLADIVRSWKEGDDGGK